jgi:hypothetical protein
MDKCLFGNLPIRCLDNLEGIEEKTYEVRSSEASKPQNYG